MTELSFAKSFLATLDNRSIKLQPDHVADIKKLELKGPGVEGIKILYQRKPVGDGRTVGEVVGAAAGGESGEGEKGVEFGVIVMGGGAAADTGEKGTAAGKEEGGDTLMGGTEAAAREAAGGEVPVAQGISGEAVLQSAEFWDDLKGWLMQRVRDESVAEGCWSLFKRGWDER
ncbi:MAG: hypothetical protein LQ350_005314 [Teloschistes chrysophthalmus]|nr:MAG: hypothetical protein LQ350_005314 [Niorma chrysophthalma]